MKFNLSGKTLTVILEIDHDDWWLMNECGFPDRAEFGYGVWYLAGKIDRSYKGKTLMWQFPHLQLRRKNCLRSLRN